MAGDDMTGNRCSVFSAAGCERRHDLPVFKITSRRRGDTAAAVEAIRKKAGHRRPESDPHQMRSCLRNKGAWDRLRMENRLAA